MKMKKLGTSIIKTHQSISLGPFSIFLQLVLKRRGERRGQGKKTRKGRTRKAKEHKNQ